jgi:preprotein translocase subunit SecA
MSDDQDPVIPTHTIRAEERRIMPNDRCPCGSGKKYKKCCGR